MKAHVYLLGLAVLCSACAAPSLRYKTEVNRLAAQGDFQAAAAKVEAKKHKMYARQDRALAYLDEATFLHDAGQTEKSDDLFARAQDRIEDLYTRSATRTVGQVLINDLTLPYSVAAYERALTYFYRAMNFLDRNNLEDATVEMRRAVSFLDNLRGSKKKGYNDDTYYVSYNDSDYQALEELTDAKFKKSGIYCYLYNEFSR